MSIIVVLQKLRVQTYMKELIFPSVSDEKTLFGFHILTSGV
jgi:hypothetical protein